MISDKKENGDEESCGAEKKPQLRTEVCGEMTGTEAKSNRRQNKGLGKNVFSTDNSTGKSRRKLGSLGKLENKFSRSVREEHSTGETAEEGPGSVRESTGPGGRERGMAWIIQDFN